MDLATPSSMGIDGYLRRGFPAVVLALLGVAAYFQASGLGQVLASAGAETDPAAPSTPSARPGRKRNVEALAREDHTTIGAAILARNPFDSVTGPLNGEAPPPPPPEDAEESPDAPTCEAARVVLITWAEDPAWSFASIAQGSGKSTLRRAGDEVGSYKVDKIDWDRVWMTGDGGRRCQMEVGGKPPVAASVGPPSGRESPPHVGPPPRNVPPDIASKIHVIDPGHITVERSVIPQLMEQQAELFRSVRGRKGKDGGLQVSGVRPGSLLDTLGVKNGDQLMTVNGMNIADPSNALQAYTQLREASKLTVALQRDGKPMEVKVDIQ